MRGGAPRGGDAASRSVRATTTSTPSTEHRRSTLILSRHLALCLELLPPCDLPD